LPVQPEVVTAARADLLAAPTRASELERGACVTQADCSDGEVCVATDIGIDECVATDGDAVSAPRDRRGRPRPAPPRGLVDGQVMRDHAARSRE
jgi:hypothetical protein